MSEFSRQKPCMLFPYCSPRLRLSGGRNRFPPIENNSCPVNFEILHSVFGMRTWIILAKNATKKQKIRHGIYNVLDFSAIGIDIFYPAWMMVVLKCSISEHCFIKRIIKVFSYGTSRLFHGFHACVDAPVHSVGITLLRGECPACFGQCRLEEMPSRSRYERHGI